MLCCACLEFLRPKSAPLSHPLSHPRQPTSVFALTKSLLNVLLIRIFILIHALSLAALFATSTFLWLPKYPLPQLPHWAQLLGSFRNLLRSRGCGPYNDGVKISSHYVQLQAAILPSSCQFKLPQLSVILNGVQRQQPGRQTVQPVQTPTRRGVEADGKIVEATLTEGNRTISKSTCCIKATTKPSIVQCTRAAIAVSKGLEATLPRSTTEQPSGRHHSR